MHKKRRRTLSVLVFMLVMIGAAAAIILYQLRTNINYFYTPADIAAGLAMPGTRLRLGGYVVKDSLLYRQDGAAEFVLTDRLANVRVIYRGALPGLFAEGDEAVVLGMLHRNNLIEAQQVLAKHDENYQPPELKELQERARNY